MDEARRANSNGPRDLDPFDGSPPLFVRADGFSSPEPAAGPAKGSREHYFHFLLGYLLPVVDAAGESGSMVRVLECGPLMTPILERTLQLLSIPHETVAKSAPGRRIFLDMWEYHADWPRLTQAADRIREAWRGQPCPGAGCAVGENLVLERSPPDAFYLNGSAERPGYGVSRRAVSNLDSICEELARQGVAHSRYEPGAHALGCQIHAFRNARRIFGVRGAEWANMVWCERARTAALVAFPGKPNGIIDRLLERQAAHYELAAMTANHAAFDPEAVLAFFQSRP